MKAPTLNLALAALTPAQSRLLVLIRDHRPARAIDLVPLYGASKQAVFSVLSRMESAGLLVLTPTRSLTLTPLAEEILRNLPQPLDVDWSSK